MPCFQKIDSNFRYRETVIWSLFKLVDHFFVNKHGYRWWENYRDSKFSSLSFNSQISENTHLENTVFLPNQCKCQSDQLNSHSAIIIGWERHLLDGRRDSRDVRRNRDSRDRVGQGRYLHKQIGNRKNLPMNSSRSEGRSRRHSCTQHFLENVCTRDLRIFLVPFGSYLSNGVGLDFWFFHFLSFQASSFLLSIFRIVYLLRGSLSIHQRNFVRWLFSSLAAWGTQSIQSWNVGKSDRDSWRFSAEFRTDSPRLCPSHSQHPGSYKFKLEGRPPLLFR